MPGERRVIKEVFETEIRFQQLAARVIYSCTLPPTDSDCGVPDLPIEEIPVAHDDVSDLAEARTAQAVLNEANEAHGTQFRLDHRFGDGFQSGAWQLIDDTGRTLREARLLIDVIDMHAGLDPVPQRCWSQYATVSMADLRDDLCQQPATFCLTRIGSAVSSTSKHWAAAAESSTTQRF